MTAKNLDVKFNGIEDMLMLSGKYDFDLCEIDFLEDMISNSKSPKVLYGDKFFPDELYVELTKGFSKMQLDKAEELSNKINSLKLDDYVNRRLDMVSFNKKMFEIFEQDKISDYDNYVDSIIPFLKYSPEDDMDCTILKKQCRILEELDLSNNEEIDAIIKDKQDIIERYNDQIEI